MDTLLGGATFVFLAYGAIGTIAWLIFKVLGLTDSQNSNFLFRSALVAFVLGGVCLLVLHFLCTSSSL